MTTERALIELAFEARTPTRLRASILRLLCGVFEAEVGLFVAFERGREVRTLHGVREPLLTALDSAWQEARRDMHPVKEQALRVGAATDRRVLGARLMRTTLFQHVMAPIAGSETLFLMPVLGTRPLGMLALGRCGGHFSDAALSHAKRLRPAVSVAYRAVCAEPDPAPNLTATDLDLLDYLELGWGARQIAAARGTSFFTVRNQLSALYRRLDATNRAEALGRWHGRHRVQ